MLNSSSSARVKIEATKKIVIKINKKDYILIKLPAYPNNKERLTKLMKETKSFVQSVSEEEGYVTPDTYVTLAVPANQVHKLIGRIDFNV